MSLPTLHDCIARWAAPACWFRRWAWARSSWAATRGEIPQRFQIPDDDEARMLLPRPASWAST
jgi:hypothetical protein